MTEVYDGPLRQGTVDQLLTASEDVSLQYHTDDRVYPLGSGERAVAKHDAIRDAADHVAYDVSVTAESGTAQYEAAIDVDIDRDDLDDILDNLSDRTGIDIKGVIGALDDLVGSLPIDDDGLFVYEGELDATAAHEILPQ